MDLIVMDNGTGTCKAGMSGEGNPCVVIETLVGRISNRGVMVGLPPLPEAFFGEAAIEKRGVLRLKRPIENGNISSWTEIEMLWRNIFHNNPLLDEKLHPILLTESCVTPNANRERMVQEMFEVFGVNAMVLKKQPVLSLFASGRISGTVLEAGSGVTNVVSVDEASVVPHTLQANGITGDELTGYLNRILIERGYSLYSFADRRILREFKEKHCYFANDPAEESNLYLKSSDLEVSVKLPDGTVLTPGSERFRCPELLFNPFLSGKDTLGVHEMIHDSIMKCPIEARSLMLENIVLGGGSTMFTGFESRLRQELDSLFPKERKLDVIANSNRKYSAWIGGSVFAFHSSCLQNLITNDDYNEHGPQIVYKRE